MGYCGQGRLPVASSVSPIDATLSSTQVKTGLEPGSKPNVEPTVKEPCVY
jgi:hypothetical protein